MHSSLCCSAVHSADCCVQHGLLCTAQIAVHSTHSHTHGLCQVVDPPLEPDPRVSAGRTPCVNTCLDTLLQPSCTTSPRKTSSRADEARLPTHCGIHQHLIVQCLPARTTPLLVAVGSCCTATTQEERQASAMTETATSDTLQHESQRDNHPCPDQLARTNSFKSRTYSQPTPTGVTAQMPNPKPQFTLPGCCEAVTGTWLKPWQADTV